MLRKLSLLVAILLVAPSAWAQSTGQECRATARSIVCTNTLNGAGKSVQIPLAGYQTVSFTVARTDNTLQGTLQAEVGFDGGTLPAAVYRATPIYVYATNGSPALGLRTNGQLVAVGAEAVTHIFAEIPPGASDFRVRISSFTGGQSDVTIFASASQASKSGWVQSVGSKSIGTVIDPEKTWAVVPHLHDGNNVDPMESAFLVQQQGNSTFFNNDGSGIVPLFAFDPTNGTFNGLTSSPSGGLTTARPIENASYNQSEAWYVNRTVTNPATGDFLNVNQTGAVDRTYFARVLIENEGAAAQLDIIHTGVAGATCTALTPVNQRGTGTATSTANHTCTTDPTTLGTIVRVNLAANSNREIDLRGFWATTSTGDGISINVVLSPGVGNDLSATIVWYECDPGVNC